MKHRCKPPPLYFLMRAIGISCIFVVCLCMMWFLSGCALQPYWKDQPSQAIPSPSAPEVNALPVPFGAKEYVTVGIVNIRKEPSTSAEVVGNLYAGVTVRAVCGDDGWCQVAGGWIVATCLGEGTGKCQAK